MLRELKQAIAPDAEADIRVSWHGGLRTVNQNVSAVQLATTQKKRDEQMRAAWDRLIRKFQNLRDQTRP